MHLRDLTLSDKQERRSEYIAGGDGEAVWGGGEKVKYYSDYSD